ncbi:VOC family protein [Lacisediminihabitans profunda]|uniref:Putative pterin-4-alpha-carbinolamine dehydratase n=1 Tax=Lacisediminihabitans profunda TaxID=2594790 RepID=A0A5C8UXM8_9MICO|nr:VOC family protein [Lacisediminihabitans profunda]TXN32391.1 4a-hydroxytetrahydrobiopterin dehydratase [Lacisediminihabitans profunda]
MTTRISPRQFHASDGVEDWRVLFDGAKTYFVTGSFAKGVELIEIIGRLADAANHHPDVDLRYSGVVVSLFTHDVGDISDRDVALAQRISAAAREIGVAADPSRVQTVQVSIDALVIPAVLPFWRAVLGYDTFGDEDVVDPLGRGPWVTFQQMDEPRPQRNRIHIDVSVPRDQAEARIAAALAAGGHIVTDAHAPHWWTLADSEGNEVDVAPWREDSD